MPDRIEDMRRRMEAAASAFDFETAGRLRDQISVLRGQHAADAPDTVDTAGLQRQRPGSMGLGTSQQRVTPPEGWRPPAKPDPLTRGRSRTRRATP